MSNHYSYLLYITEHNRQFYSEGVNLVVCDIGVVGRETNRALSLPKGLHLLRTPSFHVTIYICCTTCYLKWSCLKLEVLRAKRNTL